jgi:hypothetical protein
MDEVNVTAREEQNASPTAYMSELVVMREQEVG